MSDTSATPPGNGAGSPSAPTIGIRAQYIKDLSFENPNAPASLVAGEAQPRVDVNVNVEARGLGGANYEVALHIRTEARQGERTAFLLELEYAGLFDLARVPDQQRQIVCLVEAPRFLFPFARRIVAEATRDGGFPPVFLDPIDFAELFRNHIQSQQPAGTEPPPPPQ